MWFNENLSMSYPCYPPPHLGGPPYLLSRLRDDHHHFSYSICSYLSNDTSHHTLALNCTWSYIWLLTLYTPHTHPVHSLPPNTPLPGQIRIVSPLTVTENEYIIIILIILNFVENSLLVKVIK